MSPKDLLSEKEKLLKRLQEIQAEEAKAAEKAKQAFEKRLDKIKALIRESGITGMITLWINDEGNVSYKVIKRADITGPVVFETTENGNMEYKISKARKTKKTSNGKNGGLTTEVFSALQKTKGKVEEDDGKMYAGETVVSPTALGEYILFTTGKDMTATELRKAALGMLRESQCAGITDRWRKGRKEKVTAELTNVN